MYTQHFTTAFWGWIYISMHYTIVITTKGGGGGGEELDDDYCEDVDH